MTTLSKEDVVRMVKESKIYDWFWLRDNNIQEIDAVQNLLTLARADIVEVNKALVAENERLKARLEVADHGWDGISCRDETIKLQDSSIKELCTALAAAEADNERLREALSMHIHLVESNAPQLSGKAHGFAKEALAKPRDDSALREMIAGVYEECAKVCEDDAKGWTDYSCEMAARDCADAIRALAEKAKGG